MFLSTNQFNVIHLTLITSYIWNSAPNPLPPTRRASHCLHHHPRPDGATREQQDQLWNKKTKTHHLNFTMGYIPLMNIVILSYNHALMSYILG